MSIEYKDGTFSNNMPINEAFEKFIESIDEGTAKALHVGTNRELNEVKRKKSIEDQIKDIDRRLSAVEEDPVESEVLVIPTKDEIINVLREKNLG